MTKIDPTPLIAEAQARETALQVALDKMERAERENLFWRMAVAAIALALFAQWLVSVVGMVLA